MSCLIASQCNFKGRNKGNDGYWQNSNKAVKVQLAIIVEHKKLLKKYIVSSGKLQSRDIKGKLEIYNVPTHFSSCDLYSEETGKADFYTIHFANQRQI